jgi:hypothetical protein
MATEPVSKGPYLRLYVPWDCVNLGTLDWHELTYSMLPRLLLSISSASSTGYTESGQKTHLSHRFWPSPHKQRDFANKITILHPRESGKSRYCTLPAERFIHRFLQHVLPSGFVKIRYYGLFSPGNRPLLHRVRLFLAGSASTSALSLPAEPRAEGAAQQTDLPCPHCGQAMTLIRSLPPRKPP